MSAATLINCNMMIPCSSKNPKSRPYNINVSLEPGGAPASSTATQQLMINSSNIKRKRRPAGTPDPDAEVVSLSPTTLLESDRYVCEICNQGFQRDQNLQMHMRRHKVPWKLLKRENNQVVKKRVFVCPEPSCIHHDPCHALGDLVGIKKHYKRKHSNHKQWVCYKCSKAYAVQSDYKAHVKTCGSRGHSCDCGRVFSRVESFIEHQDTCNMRGGASLVQPAACMSQTAASPRRSSAPFLCKQAHHHTSIISLGHHVGIKNPTMQQLYHNLDLQLSATGNNYNNSSTQLQLSIGSSTGLSDKSDANMDSLGFRVLEASNTMEEMSVGMAERSHAKRQIDLAEQELTYARQIRQQAQAELEKAERLRENAMKQISSTLLEITCDSCKLQFQLERSVSESHIDQTGQQK